MAVIDRVERLKAAYSYDLSNKVPFKVDYREKSYFFPFTSRKPEKPNIKETFDGIVGVYARCVSGINTSENYDLFSQLDKAFKTSPKIFIDQEYLEELKSMIFRYLTKENGNINVLNPSLFRLLKLEKSTDKNENYDKGERDYGTFIYDIFGDANVENLFKDSETNKLIDLVNSVMQFNLNEKVRPYKSECKLPKIKNLFIEDLNYLREKEDIFLEMFPIFLHYYLMFYCSQLTIKLNSQFNITQEKMDSIQNIYYLLDDERLSSNRLASTSGYKTIVNASKTLYENLNILSTLNYLFDEESLNFKLKTFQEIKEVFESKSNDEKKEIEDSLKEWVLCLREIINFEYEEKELVDFYSICSVLARFYQQNKYKAQASRYSLNIPDLLYGFAKAHGNQGYSMSLSQKNLLFFVRLVTKDKRMKIKDVFCGLEKRGIFFDTISRQLIMEKLDKLNMLDAVSDSGDAKYVKQI